MAKTREIRRRIRAVTNIQRITKTMQMIAAARFQAAQRRAVAARPFTRKIAELVGELAAASGQGGALKHPLLQAPETRLNKELLLVITSNRGLCGAYNGNVLRNAVDYYRRHGDTKLDVELVGKKGMAYFRFRKIPVTTFHSQFGDIPRYEQVQELADRYMKTFTERQYDAVRIVYMTFQSLARQTPAVFTLLPLQPPEQKGGAAARQPAAGARYDFTPQPEKILAELLPVSVKAVLFQAFNEAAVGEQLARRVAMKAATDAAGKLTKTLTTRYNRARQTAITTELSEIIGGAASLE